MIWCKIWIIFEHLFVAILTVSSFDKRCIHFSQIGTYIYHILFAPYITVLLYKGKYLFHIAATNKQEHIQVTHLDVCFNY